MKKQVKSMILTVLLIIAGMISLIIIIELFGISSTKLKEKVGDQVIIRNDTLMIIDYSTLDGTFTLEDNRVVSKHLIIEE